MQKERLVMIPGPTPVVRSIQNQMAREMQAFGDPRFVKDYKALITDLSELFDCSGKTFPIAGTGTCAMEMAVANSTKRGDNVLVISHGFFGDRFIDICTRKGLNVDVISSEWGKTVAVEEIDKKLSEKNYAAITVSHVDTATGARADIEKIGEMMRRHPETIYIVDGVAATGGEYVQVDAMNIDILFTGSQKAFGVCPGMFILWASKKALERRQSLGTIPEYYLDFEKWIPIMDDPSKYFATPAINLVWSLAESTRMMKEEGLLNRYNRHLKNARAAQAALEALGCTILADAANRAVTLSNVLYPEGVNDLDFRNAVLEEGMVVAGGLAAYAGKMFRIGHMGNIDTNDMITAISIVERALIRCKHNIKPGQGVGVYMAKMAE